jgi:hypothetical protein
MQMEIWNKIVTLVAIYNFPPHHRNNFFFTKEKKTTKKQSKIILNL